MRPMPLPVRVAAGLVVTALEQARKFPGQLAELPVTAASRAVQAGMRVQQRVTELAIKGDEVFSLFRRVEDTPPWARFDEDDEARDEDEPKDRLPRTKGTGSGDEGGGGVDGGPLAAVLPGPEAGRGGEIDEADVARGLAPPRPAPSAGAGVPQAPGAGVSQAPGAGLPQAPGTDEPPAPPTLPGYDELSLAQLRGKLRGFSLPELEALLAHEQAHHGRAPFVTMLSNRITTVRSR